MILRMQLTFHTRCGYQYFHQHHSKIYVTDNIHNLTILYKRQKSQMSIESYCPPTHLITVLRVNLGLTSCEELATALNFGNYFYSCTCYKWWWVWVFNHKQSAKPESENIYDPYELWFGKWYSLHIITTNISQSSTASAIREI